MMRILLHFTSMQNLHPIYRVIYSFSWFRSTKIKANNKKTKQSKWWAKEFCILIKTNQNESMCKLCNILNTHRTTCLWRSTQYLIALRTMISCFLLKPFGLAKFGGTLKVPPHSAFGTNTFPLFSSSRSSSVHHKRKRPKIKSIQTMRKICLPISNEKSILEWNGW